MDYSQAVLRLHDGGGFQQLIPPSLNDSTFGSFAPSRTFRLSYTTSQLALLFAPSAALLLIYPLRVFQLREANLKVLPNRTGALKAILTVASTAINLATLVLSLKSRPLPNAESVAANVVVFVASLAVCHLSFLEHGRSVKPSISLISYLLVSLICDAFNLSSLYQRHDSSAPTLLLTVASGLTFFQLIVQSLNKRSYLREPYRHLPTEQVVSDLNRLFLFWANAEILKGNSKLLTVADLPDLDHALRSRDLRTRMEVAWETTSKPDSGSKANSAKALLAAWLKCFGRSMLVLVVPRCLLAVIRFAQPVLISRTIAYVSEPATEFGANPSGLSGSQLILAALLVYTGHGLLSSIGAQGMSRVMVQTRGAFIGLIHARCLTLRDGVYDDAAAVQHMGDDVDSAEFIAYLFQEMYGLSAEVIIGMFMLWSEIGWWCLTPLVFVLLSSQSAQFIGNRIGDKIQQWEMAKQKRIALTTSMVEYIKDIKMMGMADTIMTKLQNSRLVDIAKGNHFRWILVLFHSSGFALQLFTPVFTLVFYALDARLRGHQALDPSKAFTTVTIISLLTVPANALLATLPQCGAILGNLRRIQSYLLEPSREDKRTMLGTPSTNLTGNTISDGNEQTSKHRAISFQSVSLRPAPAASLCLEDVTIQLAQGSLNVICGAVGTGKTTLARAILGDVPPETGSIAVSSKRIGYCAQKPWLVNASIKSIVCGPIADSDFDEEWYSKVIDACGLVEDIERSSTGDVTTVGSRGITLSGGQRQRVALARAVYARPSILILDDVLSALDAKTEAHVAEKLLGKNGILRDLKTTVILITHASQHLSMADYIVVLAGSKIAEQGTWADLRSSTGYVSKLQVKESDPLSAQKADAVKPVTVPGTAAPSKNDLMDLTRKSGDASVYWYYFKSAGFPILTVFFICNLIYGITMATTPYILRAWSESGGRDMWLYVILYSLSSLTGFLSISSAIMTNFVKLNPKAGEVIHYKLLRTIMRAPLSYFATTETGNVVNRFSQDISYLDERLPMALLIVVMQTFRLISPMILLFLTQAVLTISAPPLLVVLYFLQKLYLHESRQIRFLDLESRAAVYSNFLETLEGVSAIRAFGWQSSSVDQNVERLDVSQGPHYLMKMIQLWLAVVLDLLVAGLAVMVVSLAVILRSSTTGGQIGLALNLVITISTTLVRLLEQWTSLETSLGAVARIKTLEATLLPEDKEDEDSEPPVGWPKQGSIEFRDVTASYNPETIALKGVSLTISPGQKVGICGRTGSGKSTLLLSVLRLIELDSGSIHIDGLDLSTLPRETIRSRLIAIPQDAFILNDSIRLNIDPSATVSDEEIIAVLEKVQLWSVIKSRSANNSGNTEPPAAPKKEEETDPLAAPLKTSPFSHGQFQLFGLARALLLKARSTILILDEATSNVDGETDKLMQRIIREEFSRHTILSIAHRLDTIRDADLIVVLDKGRLVEKGAPEELLAKDMPPSEAEEEKAWFRELWDGAH
ncbi:putative ABC transporter [Seiridium cardinale]|uniref:ABC transporter n=1 Tax=Seiridium cardinale TaxID=138064 RepID=A0ABR2XG44_9PEZI